MAVLDFTYPSLIHAFGVSSDLHRTCTTVGVQKIIPKPVEEFPNVKLTPFRGIVI